MQANGQQPNHILFLCVANSARSQMAECLARDLLPSRQIWSAGSQPSTPNPLAIKALEMAGLSHSEARSKGLGAIPHDRVEWVITLCAEEVCPVFPGKVRRLHWPLPDPAAATGSEAERLQAFCEVRDEIRRRLEDFVAAPPPA